MTRRSTARTPRPARTAARALAAALLGATALLLAGAGPAAAQARVTVDRGTLPAEGATSVAVAGTGFQVVDGGFGGVYVLFGWVGGDGWRPSEGGTSGTSYRYAQDRQDADNAGYQRFLAFPGGSTAGDANGVLDADGSWAVDLVVPGARFETLDAAGQPVEVDCTRVTCGVLTIGAHGVVNAANETFTPLAFSGEAVSVARPAEGAPAATPVPDAPSGTGGSDGTSGAAAGGAGVPSSGASPPAASPTAPVPEPVPAELRVDAATAVAGKVLSFEAVGLVPGEQALVTLDDGLLSVGPLVAGDDGRVTGLMPLPAGLPDGDHRLRMTGTTTGALPVLTLGIASDADALVVGATETSGLATALPSTPTLLAVAASALLLVAAVTGSLTAAVVRRRTLRRVARTGLQGAS